MIRNLYPFAFIFFLLSSAFALQAQHIKYDELIFSDSIAYVKSSKKPFTGTFQKWVNHVIVLEGKFNNGMKDSIWNEYNNDGSFKAQKIFMAGHIKTDWEHLVFKDSVAYLKGDAEPFTGIAVQYYYIIKGSWSKQLKTDQLNYATTYRHGIPDGPFIGWHNNGKRFTQGCYKNGKKNGLISYWRTDGSLQYRVETSNDLYHGTFTAWHPNGQISDIQHWKDGARNGRCAQWHENGQLKHVFHYKNGHLNGCWKEYNREGTLLNKQHFKMDYENGKYVSFNDKGQKILQCKYKKGRKTGMWTEWHDNGQLKLKGKYILSQRDGIWQWWNDQGGLISEENWDHGILKKVENGMVLSRKALFYELELRNGLLYLKNDSIPFSGICIIQFPDSSLRETRTVKFGKNDGPYIQYHPGGQIARQGYYDQNIPYGKQVFWHPNGVKQMERYHYLQKIDGPWVEWYDNGQIKVERHFSLGKKSGYWRKWTVDAYLIEEGAYKNNNKDGLWIMRDEEGHIIKSAIYKKGILVDMQTYQR